MFIKLKFYKLKHYFCMQIYEVYFNLVDINLSSVLNRKKYPELLTHRLVSI